MHKTVDVGAVLRDNPMGATLWIAVLLASSILVVDGFDNISLGFTAPGVAHFFGLSHTQIGWFLTLQQTGVTAGGIVGGMLGDRIGRRRLLAFSIALFAFGSLLTSVASATPLFVLARIIGGLGLGAVTPNAAVYLMEIIPDRWRGQLTTLASASLAIGGVLCGMLARNLTPLQWPTLFVVGGIMPLVLIPCIFGFLPESPRFMVGARRSNAQIAHVLNRLSQSSQFTGEESFTRHEANAKRAHVGELFARAFRWDTIALWTMIVTLQFATAAVLNMGTTLLTASGMTLSQAVDAMTGFTLGGAIGIVTISWLIRVLGSRIAMGAFVLLAVATLIVVTWMTGVHHLPFELLRIAIGLIGFSVMAVAMAAVTLAAQVYPTAIRSTGTGTVLTVGRLGSTMSASVIGAILTAYQPPYVFGLLTAVLAVTFGSLLALRGHLPSQGQGGPLWGHRPQPS